MAEPTRFDRIDLPTMTLTDQRHPELPLPSAATPANPAVRDSDETLDPLSNLPAQQPNRRGNRTIQYLDTYPTNAVSKY